MPHKRRFQSLPLDATSPVYFVFYLRLPHRSPDHRIGLPCSGSCSAAGSSAAGVSAPGCCPAGCSTAGASAPGCCPAGCSTAGVSAPGCCPAGCSTTGASAPGCSCSFIVSSIISEICAISSACSLYQRYPRAPAARTAIMITVRTTASQIWLLPASSS